MDTSVISKFFDSVVDADRLRLHVNMFHDLMQQKHLQIQSYGDAVDSLESDATMRCLLPELTKIVRLI